MKLEPLETRIAPAALFTFIDTDGDRVTVKTSKGSDADLAAAGVLSFDLFAGAPRQLQKIDLSLNPIFAGTDLTVTAVRVGPGGDGVTAVGFIDASNAGGGTSLNLGKVTIDGDLGRMVAGTATLGTAVKTLDVRSFGLLGTATQAGGGVLGATFTGKVGALVIKTDLVNADLSADGFDSVRVGGSIVGGVDGRIATNGQKITSIFIGGDLAGGTGVDSGSVSSIGGEVGSFILRGSLIGGSASGAGRFFPGKVGSISIGGDIRAGTTFDTGKIENNGAAVGSIVLRGSIFSDATSGPGSGSILVGEVGSVLISGSIFSETGPAGSLSVGAAKSITVNGSLRGGFVSAAKVDSLVIGGDVLGGPVDLVTAIPTSNGGGQIDIAGAVKTFKLRGDLRGGPGDNTGIVAIGGNVGTATIGGSIVGNSFAAGSVGGGRFFSGGKVTTFTLGGSLVGDGNDSGKILANAGFGALRITGDILGGDGDRSGLIDGNGTGDSFLTSLFVGGSVRGGAGDDSASIDVDNQGSAGASLFIRGNLAGGLGERSGSIDASNAISKVTVEGSVIGAGGSDSGRIDLDNEGSVGVAAVLIKGDIRGGQAADAGSVFVDGDDSLVKSVVVGGSIFGGTATRAGVLQVEGQLKSVVVNGSIFGGAATSAGIIDFDSDAVAVTIRGDLRGGIGGGSGGLAGEAIQTLTIGGSIFGGTTSVPIITAEGIGTFTVAGSIRGATSFPLRIESRVDPADALPHIAFGKINVGGNVSGAILHGGFTSADGLFDSDTQIGAVTVGGDWIASSLIAGARNLGDDDAVGGAGQNADNIDFADGNDVVTLSPGDNANVFATIASITIGGRIRGTTGLNDHFGFVAQRINAFKLAGEALPLNVQAPNDVVDISATGDVKVREV